MYLRLYTVFFRCMNISSAHWAMPNKQTNKQDRQTQLSNFPHSPYSQQICPIKNLSDGQRCRVVFAWLAFQAPHILLLDEPTNHLDMETIDALAEAINDFEGGMMLVSHDFRLINQVAEEIWVCENQTVSKWKGDILSYKTELKKKVMKQAKKNALE